MINPDLHGYHGIDIGGSKIELVAFAAGGAELREVFRERVATPGHDFALFIDAITGLVERGDAALGERAPVGIGLPGVIDSVSGRQLSSNVPALNGRRVAPALEAALQRAVAIGNDCQCFALSEADGGGAHGLPTMFGAILGTGAGGGYCANGRLQRGFNGVAGEWGHWAVPAEQLAQHKLPMVDCPCGRRGCLERYVSGPGMSMLHLHFGGDGATPMAIAARAGMRHKTQRPQRGHDRHLAHATNRTTPRPRISWNPAPPRALFINASHQTGVDRPPPRSGATVSDATVSRWKCSMSFPWHLHAPRAPRLRSSIQIARQPSRHRTTL